MEFGVVGILALVVYAVGVYFFFRGARESLLVKDFVSVAIQLIPVLACGAAAALLIFGSWLPVLWAIILTIVGFVVWA